MFTALLMGVLGGWMREFNFLIRLFQITYYDVEEDILTTFHPWLKENYFQTDKKLLAIAKKYHIISSFSILFGTVVTGEQFIEDEKRDEINKKYKPLSVDMETASIAHVCYVNDIPFLSVRTMTDTAQYKGIENFEKNCEIASKKSAEIVLGILNQLTKEKRNGRQ